jgi:FAD/FMN-containing dehydrogenase
MIAAATSGLSVALQRLSATPAMGQSLGGDGGAPAQLPASGGAMSAGFRRVRPSDPGWPSVESWEQLNREVRGHLTRVQSLLAACADDPESSACKALIEDLHNPYYIGDQAAGTQTSGWLDAWMPAPSAYAVEAATPDDVVATVNFAREHHLRLVVKGGGHSYQGTSNAADSLLLWTRQMNSVVVHDAFVAQGCAGIQDPQPAVTVEAGALWMHVYDAVTTRAGRYVQGGGCATVGVAGLVQSGGFGSFSKAYGTAAAGLLEAEIVTADGELRIANACTNPDLFWGLKGGGGGSLGVVTKLTLRTRDLPAFFGVVNATITAASDEAFQRLIGEFVRFYGESLFNQHWGEIIRFRPDNTLVVSMAFQGLDQQLANATWAPFLDWVAAAPDDFSVTAPTFIAAAPAQDWWNPAFLEQISPSPIVIDQRPDARDGNVWYAANINEVGWFIHGYASAWLPQSLLQPQRQQSLSDALFAATRHWSVALHFNKGLAGANVDDVVAARDTATHPAVLTAFALAIIGGAGPPAYPGLPGSEPDLTSARQRAQSVSYAMAELRKVAPNPGSYLAESNFFEADWQQSFWGSNYPRLRAVKKSYDPDGLFFVHHGVGSEEWSADGFARLS